jgi:putative phage-type endonuclease
MEQGTLEWFAARCGKATASRIADIIAKTKSGPAASRKNYAAELVAERLTGKVAESFQSAAMRHGTETEPEARAAYAFYRDVEIEQVGFVDHPSIPMAGASPDGLVDDDGLVEIKCPNTATHIETIFTGKIDTKYVHQMDWQMACTGRLWCDFVSFDPRLPEAMAIWISRVERNDERIGFLEREVEIFLDEVAETVARLKERFE